MSYPQEFKAKLVEWEERREDSLFIERFSGDTINQVKETDKELVKLLDNTNSQHDLNEAPATLIEIEVSSEDDNTEEELIVDTIKEDEEPDSNSLEETANEEKSNLPIVVPDFSEITLYCRYLTGKSKSKEALLVPGYFIYTKKRNIDSFKIQPVSPSEDDLITDKLYTAQSKAKIVVEHLTLQQSVEDYEKHFPKRIQQTENEQEFLSKETQSNEIDSFEEITVGKYLHERTKFNNSEIEEENIEKEILSPQKKEIHKKSIEFVQDLIEGKRGELENKTNIATKVEATPKSKQQNTALPDYRLPTKKSLAKLNKLQPKKNKEDKPITSTKAKNVIEIKNRNEVLHRNQTIIENKESDKKRNQKEDITIPTKDVIIDQKNRSDKKPDEAVLQKPKIRYKLKAADKKKNISVSQKQNEELKSAISNLKFPVKEIKDSSESMQQSFVKPNALENQAKKPVQKKDDNELNKSLDNLKTTTSAIPKKIIDLFKDFDSKMQQNISKPPQDKE